MSVAAVQDTASRYSRKDAARILSVPVQQIVAWQRVGLLPEHHGFSIRDMVRVRKLRDLRGKRLSARSIRNSVEAMRQALGGYEPLQHGSALRDGARLKFRFAGALLDPLTQQLAFDFDAAPESQPRPMLMRSGRREASQNFKRAQDLFQHAVRMEEAAGLWNAAADLYQEVLALWPPHAPAAVNLGTIFYNQKRYAEAEAQYRYAAEADPDYALAFFDLGNVLDELQKLPDAIAAYSRAIQLVPQYADAHYNLALAYERVGERRRALRHWTIYVRLDPAGPWSAHARAQARKTLAMERLSIVSRHGRLAG